MDVFPMAYIWGRNFEPDYPEGYPFAKLQEFANYCKNIVVFFKNHHTMQDMVNVAQKNTKPQCRVLVLPRSNTMGYIERLL
jgi:hypothetical protein